MRRLLFVLSLVSLAAAPSAGAQIMRRQVYVQQPSTWVSGGVALQQPWTVNDGTTGSVWAFSDYKPWVVSFEHVGTPGASVGLRGSTGRAPLRFTPTTDIGAATDADATVSQALAVGHIASGGSFHTVFELSLGATLYSDFRSRSTDLKIGPDKPDADFTFAFGYGVGYAFSPRFAIEAVQDVATVMHQKTGLSAGESTSTRMHSTRFVARVGLGGR